MGTAVPYAVPDAVRPGDTSGMNTATNADIIGRGAPGDSAPLAPFSGIGLDVNPAATDFQYVIPTPNAIDLIPPVPPGTVAGGGGTYVFNSVPNTGQTTIAFLTQKLQPGEVFGCRGSTVQDPTNGDYLTHNGVWYQLVRLSDGYTSPGKTFDTPFELPALAIDDILGIRWYVYYGPDPTKVNLTARLWVA